MFEKVFAANRGQRNKFPPTMHDRKRFSRISNSTFAFRRKNVHKLETGRGATQRMARVACVWALASVLASLFVELPAIAVAASLGSGRPATRTFSRSGNSQSYDHVAHTDTRRAATAAPTRANYCYAHGDSSSSTIASSASDGASAPGSLWLRKAAHRAVRDSSLHGGLNTDRAVGAARAGSTVVALRGGSSSTATVAGESGLDGRDAGGGTGVAVRSMKVLVSTTKISSYVDAVSNDAVAAAKIIRH